MQYIREASEDEMILEFLKGEIKSERFQANILEVITILKLNRDLIDKPDLNNVYDNKKRQDILGEFRGYGRSTLLFENYPSISRWIFAECSKEDIHNIRYINYSYWNELSKHTSLPMVAAETIREGIEVYGVSNDGSMQGVKFLENGGVFPPIILLTSNNVNYIILEGHSRMTTYGLAPKYFAGSKCFIGICNEEDLLKWNG